MLINLAIGRGAVRMRVLGVLTRIPILFLPWG